jgi:prolyl-tRNA synthetase
MGSYGIGIERILSSAIEQDHDADGIVLPASIAPFEVVVTPVNNTNAEQMTAARALYAELQQRGVDVLFDDRDERPGVKFKDADLIGIPYRITVGKKIGQGIVELNERRGKQSVDVALGEAVDELMRRLKRF